MRTIAMSCILCLLVCEGVSAQLSKVTVSGLLKEASTTTALPFVNVTLNIRDTIFVIGTISNEEGRFTLADITPGNYSLALSYVGYEQKALPVDRGSDE